MLLFERSLPLSAGELGLHAVGDVEVVDAGTVDFFSQSAICACNRRFFALICASKSNHDLCFQIQLQFVLHVSTFFFWGHRRRDRATVRANPEVAFFLLARRRMMKPEARTGDAEGRRPRKRSRRRQFLMYTPTTHSPGPWKVFFNQAMVASTPGGRASRGEAPSAGWLRTYVFVRQRQGELGRGINEGMQSGYDFEFLFLYSSIFR